MGKSIVINMERSEKLYESLKMRGFSGKITFVSKRYKIFDIALLGFALLTMLIFIFLIDLDLMYTEVFTLFLP